LLRAGQVRFFPAANSRLGIDTNHASMITAKDNG